FLADVRRTGADRQRQGDRPQVLVQRGRAGQRAHGDLRGHDRKQGLAEGHRRSRRSRSGHVHGEASMSSMKRHIIIASVCTVVFAASVSAQTIDAATVYQKNCATCHDQPKDRTPPREALKDRTPDAILQALTTGTMSVSAISLSMAEKRAVAEY